MSEATNPEIFNQEIAALEAKLAAKKQELIQSGIESPERATFKQVIREHVSPGEQSSVVLPTSATQSTAPAVRQPTDQEEQQINKLIARAFTHGLSAAVSEAKKTGDAFFIDLLHDRLADEYYAKLLAAHKIQGE